MLNSRHRNFDIMPKAPEILFNIITTTIFADYIAEINAGLTEKLKKTRELAQKYYNKYHLDISLR